MKRYYAHKNIPAGGALANGAPFSFLSEEQIIKAYSESYIQPTGCFVKVPEGLFARCRQRKMVKPVEFWYKLKFYGSAFKKKDFFKHFSEVFGVSQVSCYNNLKKCLDLKIIKQNKDNFFLCSYDKLWNKLGYNLTKYNYVTKDGYKKQRKGIFAIKKIYESHLKCSFVDVCEAFDLKLHSIRQYYTAPHWSSRMPNTKVWADGVKRERHTYHAHSVKFTELPMFLSEDIYNGKNYCIKGISCKNIANVLKYRSSASSHNLKKRLLDAGLINITEQIIETGGNIYGTYHDSMTAKKLKKSFPGLSENIQNLNYEIRLQDDFSFNF